MPGPRARQSDIAASCGPSPPPESRIRPLGATLALDFTSGRARGIAMNMLLRLWRAAAAAAFGMGIAAASTAAAESCAQDIPSVCLQSFGAGSAAISAAASEAGCADRLQQYRGCIATLVQDKGLVEEAPLSRSERGFLSALEAELADNVGRLEVFIAEKMNLDGSRAVYENDWPPLRTRFFNSTENPHYFAAPADWLARTQGFYDDVARLLARKDVREAYRRQVTSVLYQRRQHREALEKLVSAARQELLPEISAVLAPPR